MQNNFFKNLLKINLATTNDTLRHAIVTPRKNWGKAMKEMAENGDDELLIQL